MLNTQKSYILMHKDATVACIELDEVTGLITAVCDVSNAAGNTAGTIWRTM